MNDELIYFILYNFPVFHHHVTYIAFARSTHVPSSWKNQIWISEKWCNKGTDNFSLCEYFFGAIGDAFIN